MGEWVDEGGYISTRENVVGDLTFAQYLDLNQSIAQNIRIHRYRKWRGTSCRAARLHSVWYFTGLISGINPMGAKTRYVRMHGRNWKLDGILWLADMPEGIPRTVFVGDENAFFEDYIAMKLRYM